jgi:hypothetical protein
MIRQWSGLNGPTAHQDGDNGKKLKLAVLRAAQQLAQHETQTKKTFTSRRPGARLPPPSRTHPVILRGGRPPPLPPSTLSTARSPAWSATAATIDTPSSFIEGDSHRRHRLPIVLHRGQPPPPADRPRSASPAPGPRRRNIEGRRL